MDQGATLPGAALRSSSGWLTGWTLGEVNPAFPAYFPRLVQFAIWRFCAELGLNLCNGNKIDDRDRCANKNCPAYQDCACVALRATGS